MNHMYGLNMHKPGAQEYLNSIFKLYTEWGVDFIKVDDIARPYSAAEIEGYKKAIDASGKQIVLSLSPGETPRAQAAHAKQYANMWRMADDFWDNWEEVLKMFEYAKNWEGVGGPGHWPDCDMLQIGKLSKRGPVGPERYSRFTQDELKTQMTFWCIYQSPLMIGGNLPENRQQELDLFTNEEVLDVNQHGEHATKLYKTDESMVWFSHIHDSENEYVALFNIGNKAHDVVINFAQLGLKGKIVVRDLWKKKDISIFRNQYSQNINAHGAALLKLSVLKK